MDNRKRTALVLVGVILGCGIVWAASTQTWSNKDVLPVYFEVPGGQNVRQAVLDITITPAATVPTAFTLIHPDGTSDILKADTQTEELYNTDDQSPYGENISFKMIASGNYRLYLSQNNGAAPGVFASTERWCLAMTGLGTASVTATALSKDASLNDMDPDPTVFANAGLWADYPTPPAGTPTVTVFLKIPGSAANNINKVVLKMHTEADHFGMAFRFRGPKDYSAAQTSILANYYDSNEITDPGDGNSASRVTAAAGFRTLTVKNESTTGDYTLSIVQEVYLSSRHFFAVPEYWQVSMSHLPADKTFFFEVQAFDYSGAPLDSNLIEVAYPPIAAVMNPSNRPADFPWTVAKGRTFGFLDSETDLSSSYGSLSHNWALDGTDLGASPAARMFSDLDQTHKLDLRVSDTVDPNSAPLNLVSTYVGFSNIARDKLAFHLIPSETLIIPWFQVLPGAYSPPAIDGNVVYGEDNDYNDRIDDAIHPDVGWRAAFRATYQDGTEPADVAFQALRYAGDTHLYLSFEVRKDPTYNNEDLLVLAFRPNASEADPPSMSVTPMDGDVAFFISPVSDTTGAAEQEGQDPRSVVIWKYATANGWTKLTETLGALAGFTVKVKTYTFCGSKTWDVEMTIPLTDETSDALTWVTFGQSFLCYFDTIRVSSLASQYPVVSQFTWPRSSPNLTGTLTPQLLSPGEWMLATTQTGALTRGAYIESALDIGIETAVGQPLTTTITTSGVNKFVARVKNSTIREVPNGPGATTFEPEKALQVFTHFRMANWGLPGNPSTPAWADIPTDAASSNPSPPLDIDAPTDGAAPPGDYETPGIKTYSFEWTPGSWSGNLHQCMYVELDSTGNALISTKGIYQNMNFDHASEFSQAAAIETASYLPPPQGKPTQRFVLQVAHYEVQHNKTRLTNLPTARLFVSPSSPTSPTAAYSEMYWSAQGFRDTGNVLVIDRKSFRVVDPAGSFGHVLQHDGEVARWEYELRGATKVAQDLYGIDIPAGQIGAVTPVIRAVEPRWQLSVHGGIAVPVAATAGNYGIGPDAVLDFGGMIAPNLWILGLFGYHGLTGSGSTADLHLLSASLDVRYLYAIRPPFLLYGNIGFGWYTPIDSTGAIGGNVGLGAEYRISPVLAAELGLDYHIVADSSNTQFIAVTVGLLFRF